MPKIKVTDQTVEKFERPQMDGQMDRRYQTYYLPAKQCSAVDNEKGDRLQTGNLSKQQQITDTDKDLGLAMVPDLCFI